MARDLSPSDFRIDDTGATYTLTTQDDSPNTDLMVNHIQEITQESTAQRNAKKPVQFTKHSGQGDKDSSGHRTNCFANSPHVHRLRKALSTDHIDTAGSSVSSVGMEAGQFSSNNDLYRESLEYNIYTPIVGHEIMESRTKFTVYKIHVHYCGANWFVFRRYADFERLHKQIKSMFPDFLADLPGKRIFRNNFDPSFLKERETGLQIFIQSILLSKEMCASVPVRQFLCLDEKPRVEDSFECCRAMCESLQELVSIMQQQLRMKSHETSRLEMELTSAHQEIDVLQSKLANPDMCKSPCSQSPLSVVDNTAECASKLLDDKISTMSCNVAPDHCQAQGMKLI